MKKTVCPKCGANDIIIFVKRKIHGELTKQFNQIIAYGGSEDIRDEDETVVICNKCDEDITYYTDSVEVE